MPSDVDAEADELLMSTFGEHISEYSDIPITLSHTNTNSLPIIPSAYLPGLLSHSPLQQAPFSKSDHIPLVQAPFPNLPLNQILFPSVTKQREYSNSDSSRGNDYQSSNSIISANNKLTSSLLPQRALPNNMACKSEEEKITFNVNFVNGNDVMTDRHDVSSSPPSSLPFTSPLLTPTTEEILCSMNDNVSTARVINGNNRNVAIDVAIDVDSDGDGGGDRHQGSIDDEGDGRGRYLNGGRNEDNKCDRIYDNPVRINTPPPGNSVSVSFSPYMAFTPEGAIKLSGMGSRSGTGGSLGVISDRNRDTDINANSDTDRGSDRETDKNTVNKRNKYDNEEGNIKGCSDEDLKAKNLIYNIPLYDSAIRAGDSTASWLDDDAYVYDFVSE